MLVHGGIGREFSPVWADLPHGWHQLCVSAPDFMLLGSKTDFTAMRAWKLLQQVDDLEARGAVFPNLRGFLNLVAFAYHVDFELVPAEHEPGSDLSARRLHAAIAPRGADRSGPARFDCSRWKVMGWRPALRDGWSFRRNFRVERYSVSPAHRGAWGKF